MTTAYCPLDDTALPTDRYVCRTCTGTLRGLLQTLPDLMADLDAALTKSLRFGTNAGRRGADTPMPMSYTASEAGYVARTTILTWVDWITAVRGHRCPETWAEVASYLRDHGGIEWAARHPDGPQAIDELTAAIRHARRAVDRPAERTYVGVCGALIEIEDTAYTPGQVVLTPTDCPEALYALADRDTVDCPRCGTTWDVRERQGAMLRRIRGHELHAADIERVFGRLGMVVDAARVRQWKRRGVITPVRSDADGRPLYRVGDVLDAAQGRTGVQGRTDALAG